MLSKLLAGILDLGPRRIGYTGQNVATSRTENRMGMSTKSGPAPEHPEQAHWNQVHATKAIDDVSWWQPESDLWIDLIEAAAADHHARIIDVGAGSSVLVDALLDRGYSRVSVLDLAEPALENVRQRISARRPEAGADDLVEFVVGDVRTFRAAHPFDLWHDRAVLHFLTDPLDVAAYRESVTANLVPGGRAVISTFAPDGPEQCSGLTVQRYDADSLAAAMGPGFTLISHERRIHRTPWDTEQPFTVVTLERTRG